MVVVSQIIYRVDEEVAISCRAEVGVAGEIGIAYQHHSCRNQLIVNCPRAAADLGNRLNRHDQWQWSGLINVYIEVDVLCVGFRPAVQRADRNQFLANVRDAFVGERYRLRVDAVKVVRRAGHVQDVEALRQRVLRQLAVGVLDLEERRVGRNVTRRVDDGADADADCVSRQKAFECIGVASGSNNIKILPPRRLYSTRMPSSESVISCVGPAKMTAAGTPRDRWRITADQVLAASHSRPGSFRAPAKPQPIRNPRCRG